MPKSSNAIYLLFEQWECLRVTKLFSWARRRNSSQPGSKLNKLQETPWSLLSRNTLTLIADLTLGRCQSKFASYWLSLSRLLLSAFNLWQYQYRYWFGRHWTNIVIISLLGSWTGHRWSPGYAGVTWVRERGSESSDADNTRPSVSGKYP